MEGGRSFVLFGVPRASQVPDTPITFEEGRARAERGMLEPQSASTSGPCRSPPGPARALHYRRYV